MGDLRGWEAKEVVFGRLGQARASICRLRRLPYEPVPWGDTRNGDETRMPAELVASNVVVVARQFNPSVFSNLWLVRNGIISESEFMPGCMYSDQVAKMETVRFGLLVIPPQLQLQPRVGRNEEGELVATTVGRIVNLLPHTPYVATGLNFVWHVWPDDGDISRFSKSLFLRRIGPFQAVFGNCSRRVIRRLLLNGRA